MPYIAPGLFVPEPYKPPAKKLSGSGSLKLKPGSAVGTRSKTTSVSSANAAEQRLRSLSGKKSPAAKKPTPKVKKPQITYSAPASSGRSTGGSSYAGGGPSGGGGSAGPSGASIASAVYSDPKMQASLLAQARAAVNAEINPQIEALRHSSQTAQKTTDQAIAELGKRLGMTKADLNSLYGALDVTISANLAKMQQLYGQTKTAVGSQYDQLSQALESNYSGAQNRSAAELERLGISGSGSDRLAADKALMLGNAANQKNNAQSTLEAMNASAQQLGTLQRGAGSSSNAMYQAQAQRSTDDQIGDLNKALTQLFNDNAFKRDQLNASKGNKIQMTLKALQDQMYQRQMDAQQQEFMNSIRAAQLGIDQARLTQQGEYQNNSLLIQAKRLDAELQKGAASAAKPQTGLERAGNYLATNFKNSKIPQSQLMAAFIDVMNGNTNDPGYKQGQGTPAFDKRFIAQYAADMAGGVRDRGWDSTTLNALINAMHYYFGV